VEAEDKREWEPVKRGSRKKKREDINGGWRRSRKKQMLSQ